jgi:hypothetical protein
MSMAATWTLMGNELPFDLYHYVFWTYADLSPNLFRWVTETGWVSRL